VEILTAAARSIRAAPNIAALIMRGEMFYRYHLLIALSITICSWTSVQAQGAAQDFYVKGKELSDHKAYEEALKYLNFSLQADQKYVPALIERAAVYVILQQPENAIADCDSLISLKALPAKSMAQVYKIRAESYTENRHYKLAEQDFTQAIALDSANPDYFRYRAGVRVSLKDTKGAIADFGSAIALNPARASGDYWGRGKLYAAENQYDKALKDFDKAIEQNNGGEILIYIDRAEADLKVGKYEKAVADCSHALEHLKSDLTRQKQTYWALKVRATAYDKMGKTLPANQDRYSMRQIDVPQI
jgi:tetratricopeptide (TPR) repeat protein